MSLRVATGKQARVANHDESSRPKNDNSPPKQQQHAQNTMVPRATDPGFNAAPAQQPVEAPRHKRIPDDNIAKLIAEENESKTKFPQYPGLERWELVEKMGDGAFSNVYRARDLDGSAGEVAIKVVRKFEMNSMQVRGVHGDSRALRQPPFLAFAVCFPFLSEFPLPTLGLLLEQQTSPSRL